MITLGDENRKIGEGIKVDKDKNDDNGNIVEHFLHDIITTAIIILAQQYFVPSIELLAPAAG